MAEPVSRSARDLELPVVWAPPPGGRAAGGGRPAPDRAAAADVGPARVWCSGFIANRRELLAATGLSPAASAADILRALFRRHGPACAQRIIGPFAWIVLDPERGELVAARDRAGIHGIYYAECGGGVVVADRVGEVRLHLQRPGELNLRALVAQSHGFAPLPDETCFAGVRALPPGSLLIGSANGLRLERYWRLAAGKVLRLDRDGDYAEAFRELLFTVVEQYRPAGPSAATVSSGLDSTAVAAALRATGAGSELRLFTFGLPGLPTSDESEGAAAVAEFLDLPLEIIPSEGLWPMSGWDSLELLEEGTVVTYQELWNELFQRLRQRGLRVAFTGVSGDHLFGGTGVLLYPDLLLGGRWRQLALRMREHREQSGEDLSALLGGHLLRPLVKAFLPRRWAVARQRLPWLRREYHRALLESRPADRRRWRMLPGRRLRLAALEDGMLPFGSLLASLRAAAQGIELRHPLTDHRLLEFAATLPLDQCLRAGVPKMILRNAMRGYLPERILRPQERVMPFALFEHAMREREQRRVRELITGMRAAELGLVDEAALRQAFERYLQGSGSTVFWHTLTLEAWLRRYA